MQKQNKKIGAALKKFIHEHCALYNSTHRKCDMGYECLIEQGEPCTYFESGVLMKPDYKYKPDCFVNNYRFEQKVRKQYRKINPEAFSNKKMRHCKECGRPVGKRKRYCEKCLYERQKKQKREYIRNQRK